MSTAKPETPVAEVKEQKEPLEDEQTLTIIKSPKSLGKDKPVRGDWNSRLEEAALDIGHAAQGYKHMHIIEAQKANKLHTWLMGTGIVMGPLASVLSSVGLALDLEADPGIAISVIVMGFLSGIVVAAVKFGKYDEVSNANKSAAARYTSIEANVRRQLGMYRKDRIAAIRYMDWLETKYEELLLSSPLISSRTHSCYTKQARIRGLPMPEHTININKSRTQDKVDSSHIQVTVTQEEEEDTDDEGTFYIKTREPANRSGITKHVKPSMTTIPQLNHCSDKILQYEMHRLMGVR